MGWTKPVKAAGGEASGPGSGSRPEPGRPDVPGVIQACRVLGKVCQDTLRGPAAYLGG